MTSLLDLPLEITDDIIDLLHDDRDALKFCCLVSTLLVPRTRKHLFKDIMIKDLDMLQRWKKTFPDPSKSPALVYTHSLIFRDVEDIITGGVMEGCWIQSFTNVVRLEVCGFAFPSLTGISLDALHILSAVKSLRLHTIFLPTTEVFKLICSLHHLKDLDIRHFFCRYIKDTVEWKDLLQASTSPPLTGTLLTGPRSLGSTVRLLLALPSGLHFRKIVWEINPHQEVEEVETLVEACSDTLECIHTKVHPYGEPCSFVPCRCFGF